jgi:hypothetical protein
MKKISAMPFQRPSAFISPFPPKRSKTGVKLSRAAQPGAPLYVTTANFPPYNFNHADAEFIRGGRRFMKEAIDVRVVRGVLKVTGEIPVSSTKEEIEDFISEIHLMLAGSKELPARGAKKPRGVTPKEMTEADAAIYIAGIPAEMPDAQIRRKKMFQRP